MKAKFVIIALALACVLLAALLFRSHKVSDEHTVRSEASILRLSNDLVQTSSKLSEQLGEQKQVNVLLETNLIVQSRDAEVFSNRVVQLAERLARTEASAKAAAEVAEKEIAKRDVEIARREKESDELTQRMGDLNSTIGNLERSITETERKLATSEGDRAILIRELKRLQAEKAELERQFNDLAVLRDQVRKLREELSISRRIEWIKRGLYGAAFQKGAERLQAGPKPIQSSTNESLNVEISRQGGAKIVPADKSATAPLTNAPGSVTGPSTAPKLPATPTPAAPTVEPKK